MRKWITGLAFAAAATILAAPAFALEAGDPAGDFTGKDFINTGALSMKKLRGRVIFYEIFRTW